MSLGVRVTYLPVGQGTANMVEVYDYDLDARTETLVQLYLIDCGGDSPSNHVHSLHSQNIILNAMALRAASIPGNPCTHYLDVLTISHQDMDHYNIMENIIDKFKSRLRIGKYYRFMENPSFPHPTSDRFKGFDAEVEQIATEKILFNSANYYQNPDSQFFKYFVAFEVNDTKIGMYILFANADRPDKSMTIASRRNTLSLYIVLEIGCETFSRTFHFPGDATVYTMNKIISMTPSSCAVNEMAAPHHGSILSSCDDGRNATCHTILDSFYEKIIPRRQYISAGPNNTHGHPHITYVTKILNIVTDGHKNHNICYNKTDDKANRSFAEEVTSKGIYTLCGLSKCNVISSSHFIEKETGWIHTMDLCAQLPSFISEWVVSSSQFIETSCSFSSFVKPRVCCLPDDFPPSESI